MAKFNITAGDDFTLQLIWGGSANPVDITGYTARMMWRRSYYEDPEVSEVAIIGGVDGKITFTLTPAETSILVSTLSARSFLYDVELTDLGGKITTISKGSILVTQAVTR